MIDPTASTTELKKAEVTVKQQRQAASSELRASEGDDDAQKSRQNQVQLGEVQGLGQRIEQKLATLNVKLQIRVNMDTGRQVVQVINRDSGEVVREIPPEELVRLEASIDRMIGIFFDQQA